MAGTASTDAHPISGAVSAMRAQAREVVDQPLWSLSPEQTRDTLGELTALASQVAELEARLLGHGETVEVHAECGATSVANWFSHATRQTRVETHRKTRLATALGRHPLTREALARGEVRTDQARVVCDVVDDLPDDDAVTPEVRGRAEKHLLAEAAHYDAKTLRILGRRLLEVVDPVAADEYEAKRLAEEEREARRKTRFSMHSQGNGQTEGNFVLPDAQASMLEKMLRALATPKHRRAVDGAGGYDHERPTPEKMGQAFCELTCPEEPARDERASRRVENYPKDKLPHAGGVSATCVVLIPHEILQGKLQAAHLDTGVRISPQQALRLACRARLVPAVIDGDAQVLHLGRGKRLFSEAQRLAHTVEQATCEHPTCDVPAAFCHGHHRTPWSHGGRTDLDQLQWLCPRHHTLAHQRLADHGDDGVALRDRCYARRWVTGRGGFLPRPCPRL